MWLFFALSIFFVWCVILSFVLFKTRHHYFRLIRTTRKEGIDDILNTLLDNDENLKKNIETIKKEIHTLTHDMQFHIQKIGLLRFNPFGKTGGEQSFVLAFLDGVQNGLVVNFIYTHEGMRIYTKKIKHGLGEEYELSEEEKKAIEKVS